MRKVLPLVASLMSFHVLADAGTSDNWIQVRGGTWSVPLGEVAQMANQIQAAAANARGGKEAAKDVSAYVIQFKGVGPIGRRAIELRGSCEADGLSREELRESFRNVLDGGECYFGAIWDATERKFKYFQFNGVA